MNCKRIERFIPLYIENDLDERTSAKVKTHIESCASCSTTTAQFEESQQWLFSLEVPAPAPEALGESRRVVLGRVTSQPPTGGMGWLFAARGRMLQGGALAVVLAVVLAAVLWSSHRSTTVPSPADNALVETGPPPAPSTAVRGTDQKVSQVAAVGARRRRLFAVTSQLGNGGQFAQAPIHESDIQTAPPEIEDNSAASGDLGPADESDLSMQRSDEQYPSEKDMLRIEIQTNNPTVRIIWFAPRAAVKIDG